MTSGGRARGAGNLPQRCLENRHRVALQGPHARVNAAAQQSAVANAGTTARRCPARAHIGCSPGAHDGLRDKIKARVIKPCCWGIGEVDQCRVQGGDGSGVGVLHRGCAQQLPFCSIGSVQVGAGAVHDGRCRQQQQQHCTGGECSGGWSFAGTVHGVSGAGVHGGPTSALMRPRSPRAWLLWQDIAASLQGVIGCCSRREASEAVALGTCTGVGWAGGRGAPWPAGPVRRCAHTRRPAVDALGAGAGDIPTSRADLGAAPASNTPSTRPSTLPGHARARVAHREAG